MGRPSVSGHSVSHKGGEAWRSKLREALEFHVCPLQPDGLLLRLRAEYAQPVDRPHPGALEPQGNLRVG